ncbi:MAG: acyl carrier protein [Bacteroidota bacterium]
MNKQEFISKLKEQLELESEIDMDTNLKELDEWDSMNAMILIGFVSDTFGTVLKADDIKEMTTVESLIAKIGEEKITAAS